MATTTLLPAHEPVRAPERAKDAPDRKCSSRVLLVEDDPLTAEVFARALTRDGHMVEVARDGLQALRRMRDGTPSLLVLDMNLPTLSGAEVVRRLREDGHRDVPVIVVSGTPRAGDSTSAATLWPGTWIEKPVKPRDLVQIVREFLREAD